MRWSRANISLPTTSSSNMMATRLSVTADNPAISSTNHGGGDGSTAGTLLGGVNRTEL
jgi:hypothetical protein